MKKGKVLLCLRLCWLVIGLASGSSLLARPVTVELASDDRPEPVPETTASANASPPIFAPNPPATSPFPADAEIFSSTARAGGSVIFIIGFILGLAFLLKRYMPRRFGSLASQRHIEVIETVALGERQSLTLVKAGNSYLLLARTASSITLLNQVELLPEVTERAALETEAPLKIDSSGRIVSRAIGHSAPQTKFQDKAQAWVSFGRDAIGRALGKLRSARPKVQNGRQQTTAGLESRLQPAHTKKARHPSFDEVMQAELNGAPRISSDDAVQLLSRLSEIRSELQAR